MWQQQDEITDSEGVGLSCVLLKLISNLHFTCATVRDEMLPMDMQPRVGKGLQDPMTILSSCV